MFLKAQFWTTLKSGFRRQMTETIGLTEKNTRIFSPYPTLEIMLAMKYSKMSKPKITYRPV